MVKEKTKFISSDSFRKRYGQHLETCLINKSFQKAVKEIRKEIGVSTKGFEVSADGFKAEKEKKSFQKWLRQFNKDGKGFFFDFTTIHKAIEKHKNIIYTKPDFLIKWFLAVEDMPDSDVYDDYFKFYYNEKAFVLTPPIIEVYENYINERPFVGVFEYILFNKAVVPRSNLIAIKERDFNEMNYILLAISPNTAKRDVIELWPEISKHQKIMNGYNKNKIRFKKNFKGDLKILKYDKETEKMIKNKKGEEKIIIKTRRLYDNIDKLNNIDSANDDLSNDKKIMFNRRQRKSRANKKYKI